MRSVSHDRDTTTLEDGERYLTVPRAEYTPDLEREFFGPDPEPPADLAADKLRRFLAAGAGLDPAELEGLIDVFTERQSALSSATSTAATKATANVDQQGNRPAGAAGGARRTWRDLFRLRP